ncbi:MAG: Gfo/Idh/MocA family oxidoreductase, partial [Alphaproteobacteria bacterium]|nr:Gfo/Idh/MocA family oxidoreductase [Alphaproteobacteria bacterium]
MTHRIGIIGLGIMGQRMLAAMSEHSAFTVAAAWDPSDEAMAALGRAHPAIERATSAAALAARADLAAIYVASPPASHPAYVNLAWDHGKAVLCEKPLAVDLAAAEALAKRDTAERRHSAINFPFASSLAARAMMDAAASGALGTIESIAITADFARWPRSWQQAGAWLSQRAEGGFTREVLSHFLFLAARLAGPLTLIEASPTYPPDGIGAETAITARLGAGAVAVTVRGGVGTTAADDTNSLTITGAKGAMRLHDWVNLARREDGAWREVDFGPGPPVRQRSTAAQLDGVAAMIEGRPHRLATLGEGAAVQRC